MSDLNPNLLLPPFQFLIDEFGFRIASSGVDAESFGNMFITLTNGSVNVIVSRDRSYVSADVGPSFAPERCLPVELIRKFVLGCDPNNTVALDEQADFLRSHYTTVAEMLSAAKLDDTVRLIREFGGRRFR